MFKRLALFIIILLSLSGQIWAEPGPGPGAPIGGISNTFTGSFFDFNSSVRLKNHLGPELVTNGTFTGAATGWTLGTGWAYSANTVVKNDDGTGTLSPTTALTITANSIYRVAYVVSSMTVSSVTASLGGITMPISEDNDASVVFYIVATNTNNLAFTPTNTSRFTIDTISVKKVGTYTADSVLLFEDDVNAVNGNGGLFLIGENKQINRIGGGFGLGDPQIINHQNSGLANYEYGFLGKISSSAGGLYLGGYTDADNAGAVQLYGYLGTADPTDTNAAVLITGVKKNGTGAQALGALETVLQILNSTTGLVTITGSGNVFIGDPVNTKSTLGLTINQADKDDEILSLKSTDVAHDFTSLTESSTYGKIIKNSSAGGGAHFAGMTDADSTALSFNGWIGVTDPADDTAAILISGRKLSGTSTGFLGNAETALAIQGNPNFISRFLGSGSLLINETVNTNSTIGLTIQQGANDDTIFALKSSDVGHSFSFVESDTYAYMQKLSATAGGLFLGSMTDGDATAMMLLGMIGNNNPADTTPAIKLIGGKLDVGGTGLTVLGDSETVLQVLTGDSVTTTALFTILGSGYTGVRDAAPAVPFSVSGYAAQDATDTTASLNSGNAAKNTTLQFRQTTTPRWALTSESGGANFNIYQYTAGWLIALDLDSNLNMGLATSLFGTNAAKVFAIGSGTAPTTSPADAVQMWSADLNAEAGKAALHLRTEDGAVLVFGSNVGIGTTTFGTSLAGGLAMGVGTAPTGTITGAQLVPVNRNSATSTARLHEMTQTGIISPIALQTELDATVNPKAMAQAVNMTAAASGSTGITVADNDNIDFGTGNFTLGWKGSLPSWVASSILLQKLTGGVGYQLETVVTTGIIRLTLNATAYNSSVAPVVVAGTNHEIMAVVTVGAVNTTVDFYFDGIPLGAQQTAANPGTVSSAAALYVLGTSAVRTAGTASNVYTYNRALTAAEVLSLYNKEVNFADKWGSQTPTYSSNFSAGVDSWAGASGGALSGNIDTIGGEDDWLRFTVDNLLSTHFFGSATNFSFVLGKKYKISFKYYIPSGQTVVNSFNMYEGLGSGLLTTLSTLDAATTYTFEYDPLYTTGFRLYAATNGSITIQDAGGDDVFYIKSWVVTEIGATLALEPEGIQVDVWKDSSTNGLNASYPTAGSSFTRPFPTNNADQLLSVTNVSLAANADTTIYTVPTGKRLVLTKAILIAGADAGATSTIAIGADGTETDWIPANTLSNLDAANDSVLLLPVPNTTPVKGKSYAAGVVIQAQVGAFSGGATNALYLFGFLY